MSAPSPLDADALMSQPIHLIQLDDNEVAAMTGTDKQVRFAPILPEDGPQYLRVQVADDRVAHIKVYSARNLEQQGSHVNIYAAYSLTKVCSFTACSFTAFFSSWS